MGKDGPDSEKRSRRPESELAEDDCPRVLRAMGPDCDEEWQRDHIGIGDAEGVVPVSSAYSSACGRTSEKRRLSLPEMVVGSVARIH